MCFDVAVTCPLQAKYVDSAVSKALHAAEDYAKNVKNRTYRVPCAERGLGFTPLVVESLGS